MERQKIKFYILIPVYNTEKQISGCIDSVLNQTYSNFEIVIVDDGTPDKAGLICDEYAKNDNRIHIIHQKNQGPFIARQHAILYVLQKEKDVDNSVIMFLDSDDSYYPYTLERINDTFHKNSAEMVIFHYQCVRQDGTFLWGTQKNSYEGTVTNKRELYKIVLFDDRYNSLCRKAALLRAFKGIQNEEQPKTRHGEDLIQSLPLYRNVSSVLFLNEVLYRYMENNQSLTRSMSVENYHVTFEVSEIVQKFLKEENVWTTQDYQMYLKKERQYIEILIQRIVNLSGSWRKRKELLNDLRKNQYCESVLSNTHGFSVWITLWKIKWYIPLKFLEQGRTFLKRIYHSVKRK